MSRLARTVGVVAAGVALAITGAGVSMALAGATPQGYSVPASPAVPVKVEKPTPLNLTTLDTINEYLRSQGFDPSTFVVQQGPMNYAGPNCPGAVFNCTTATRVIQIATGGAAALSLLGPTAQSTPPNEAECTASPEEGADIDPPAVGIGCVIFQTASGPDEVDQQASCKVVSAVLVKQVCSITQTNNSGGNNQASISMKIDSSTGPTQLADQEGFVSQQTRGGGNNQFQGDETIALATSGSPTEQDGYQSLFLSQQVFTLFLLNDAVPATGNNEAQMTHSQNLTAFTASGGTQAQNAGEAPFGDPCVGEVEDANSCVEYHQGTGSGTNQFTVNQKHDLKATSGSSNVTQVQGCDPREVDKPCGLEEVGSQSTDDESKNRSDVVQGGTWVLEAPDGPPAMIGSTPCPLPRPAGCVGLSQIQDPHFGGAGTMQSGGENDAFTLSQLAVLRASDAPGVAIQSHVNDVDDQSTGEVTTKSTIVTNDDPPSVVTCSGDGQRCTYEQRCSNVEPGPEDPELFCPRNGEQAVPPTTTTTITDID